MSNAPRYGKSWINNQGALHHCFSLLWGSSYLMLTLSERQFEAFHKGSEGHTVLAVTSIPEDKLANTPGQRAAISMISGLGI
jgi:hypothetical protein